MKRMGRPQSTKYVPGLAELLQDRNMSAVARRLNISVSSLFRIRDLERGASDVLLRDLAVYFDTTPDRLIGQDQQLTASGR